MSTTPEQRLAIETEGHALVVEAGAGTGKTSVLADRFMFLLDRHPDWPLESIVAVTFTKKATREMRSRIRTKVEEMAAGRPDDAAWQERRRGLDRLMVETVHGLCARLLRENAIAAQVDPLFNVLEETDAELLKEEALRKTLTEAVADTAGEPWLELLASLRVRDLQDEMASLQGKRGTVSRLFPEVTDEGALLARWQAGIREMVDGLWRDALVEQPGLADAVRALPGVPIGDQTDLLAEAVRLAQQGCELVRIGVPDQAWPRWAQIKRVGGRASAWGGTESLKELKALLGALQTAGKELGKYSGDPGVSDEQAARALVHWRGLWDRVEATYTRLKEDRQSLDFDDLEILTDRLLHRQPLDPRLAAWRAGVHQVMVDEFQDANRVQQSIVYALAHPNEPGRLFVVGDPKQSIYRFRQAQVSLFHETAGDVRQATGQPPLPLSCSFRAHRSLVDAQNYLFARILQPLGAAYKPYEVSPGPLTAFRDTPSPQVCAPAPVELWLLPAKDEEDEKLAITEIRAWEARLLARRLRGLREAGLAVWDKAARQYRPFRFSDAAILFRATTDLPLYEEQFKAEGLPYVTVSGRGYFDRPEVRDMAALLACLRSPADDLNLAAVLRSPLFSLSDETLYRLRWRLPDGQPAVEPVALAAALKAPPPTGQPEEVTLAAAILAELWSLAGRVEVWELLQAALDRTGYEAALALSDAGAGAGGRQRNNLSKFMSFARERGGASLSDLLRRVQDLTEREAREGEALAGDAESGAVQLMSIHAAKGLEFPVVVVADMGRQPRGGHGKGELVLHDPAFGVVCKLRDENGDWKEPPSYKWGKWLDGKMDEAERKRLLYVACTRAADLLILSGKCGEKASWLESVLESLAVNAEGDPDELLAFPGFGLRVVRPKEQLPELRPPEEEPFRSPGIAEMPALASPLPPIRPWRPLAVTTLRRRIAAGDDEWVVRPAVEAAGADEATGQAPGFLLGTIVHRALADWRNLDLPEGELRGRLAAYARREGIESPRALGRCVDLAAAMVADVRGSPLYDEVSRAPRRSTEVPFTWASPAGVLTGVIDLLYQDAGGGWRLIDWKTGRLGPGLLEERAAQYRLQVAVYGLAAANLVGAVPDCALCFVQAGAVLHRYDPGELARAWQEALTVLGKHGV